MVTKIVYLNPGLSDDELILRKDIEQACEGSFKLEFVETTNLWIEAKTNEVKITSPEGEISIDDAYFFIRLRKNDAAFVALLCHILKLSGVEFTDKSSEYHTSYVDKSFAIPRLALNGFMVPESIIVSAESLKNNIDSIEKSFIYPCVVKGKGSRGESVELAHSRDELLDFVDRAMTKSPQTLITIQTRIENSYDVRALFMGDNFLGAMKRARQTKEPLLNNVSKGGLASVDEMTAEEINLCKKVMKIGLVDFCGIDFFRTEKGLVFIELNRIPQFAGIRRVIPDLSVGAGLVSLVKKLNSQ